MISEPRGVRFGPAGSPPAGHEAASDLPPGVGRRFLLPIQRQLPESLARVARHPRDFGLPHALVERLQDREPQRLAARIGALGVLPHLRGQLGEFARVHGGERSTLANLLDKPRCMANTIGIANMVGITQQK